MDDETNGSDDTDEKLNDEEREYGTNTFGSPFGSSFGLGFSLLRNNEFDADSGYEYSDQIQLSIRMLKAGSVMRDFAEFVDEHDIDMSTLDQHDIQEMDEENQQVMYAFISMSSGLQSMADTFDSDDDDDNPFKVSDGDDPVY